MTHVTRKKHLLTVYTLVGVILIIVALFIYLEINNKKVYTLTTNEDGTVVAVDQDGNYYLQNEDVFIIQNATTSKRPIVLPIEKVLFEYVEIKDSCGVHFEGECVVTRSGPGLDFPVVLKVRNNVVLKVGGEVEHDGHLWYKIIFDEFVRYPDRIQGYMYIAADYVNVVQDEGDKTIWDDGSSTTSKRIVVDRTEQKLYAYEGDTLFMETSISTGLELSPTPPGTFTIFKKTPSRYMQGPLPGFTDTYDLPGVPWNLYFTYDGAVIHGAYWHDSFGTPYSHGCVNLSPEDAHKLYKWAVLGTKVTVKDT